MAAPCAIVSAVAWMLLQVLMRRGFTPASPNHFITVLCRRAGGGGTRSWYCSRSAGVNVRRGSVSDVLANHPNTLTPSGSCDTCGATVGSRHDRDVERLVVQARAHHARVAHEHARADGRVLLLHPLQELGQADEREGLVHAEAQRALQRIARAEALDQLAGGGQHAVGVLDERVPFRGEADPRAAAHEERRLQRRLELADALRHRRLRQLELERRGVKAAEAHDALERAELSEGHVHDRAILS